jgi:hypothetical protein
MIIIEKMVSGDWGLPTTLAYFSCAETYYDPGRVPTSTDVIKIYVNLSDSLSTRLRVGYQ